MDLRRLICALTLIMLIIALAPAAGAQEITRWQVNYQHVILDVGHSGQVNVQYEIDADIVKGVWNEVWIPLSDPHMTVSKVVDGSGKEHAFRIEYGNGATQIKAQDFNLHPGDHVNLKIYSAVYPFVYRADQPAGYDIVSFVPVWWDMTIPDTQVKFYLPAQVPKDEIRTGDTQYSNFMTEGNQSAVYFQARNLAPNQQFPVAVSFPDQYMDSGVVAGKATVAPYIPPGSGASGGLLDSILSLSCPGLFILVFIVVIIGSFAASFTRQPYSSPVVSMDGIGVNKNLDPVEAATLLRIDPKRVLTMIMFELMKKGNIKLVSTDPIMLEVVSKQGLNYYEKLFVDAIDRHMLLEHKLLECFKVLARRVVDKTRPYCRKDTENYYRSKIDEAWDAIKAVDTPELKLEKYDAGMIWLMADEQFANKTKDYVADAPGSGTVIVPQHYWWYPYYFGIPHYGGYGTPQPSGGPPQQPSQPGTAKPSAPTNQTTASVESFANSISNSVESMSAGVVTGVEEFLGVRNAANAPPPARPFASGPSSFSGKSSCACVSCACACVSCACACACAGGGGGCT